MHAFDGISMVVRILSASEGRPTKEDMDERACRLAAYMIETGATVRSAAQKFGISKSTVHKDDGVIIGTVKGSAIKALILAGSEPVRGKTDLIL